MFTTSRNLSVPRFGTIPRGLTTVGFSHGGNNVTTLAANISTTTDETNSWCSFAERVAANSLVDGATSVHKNWYPFSIQSITTVLLTNDRQNSLQLRTLPAAMAPWPAGSHGSYVSTLSSGYPHSALLAQGNS